nr:metallophosphoesterase [Gemmatimonadaceae bacterium]
PPPPPPPGDVTIIAAGDIADCNNTNDDATATLVDNIPGTVLVLGDNAYESGTKTEYDTCYNPNWGRSKDRTKPSPGNHEYQTAGAAGYYEYFGAAAGDPAKGYYSFDLGAWHIIALNSSLSVTAGSAQEVWLRADLAASTRACTLAYWHHPRFSSGSVHGNNSNMQPLWQALYDANADVVLGGHDHIYERFAPQTPTGVSDATRGIREFVVGTGGRGHYGLGTLKANSQVFDATSFGVLKMTLSATGYSWEFVPVAGATFTDSGSGACH